MREAVMKCKVTISFLACGLRRFSTASFCLLFRLLPVKLEHENINSVGPPRGG